MKLSKILRESITLSRYKPIITEAVMMSIKDIIDYIPNMFIRIPPKLSYDIKNGNIDDAIKFLAPQLRKVGYQIASFNIKKHINYKIPEVEKKTNIIFKNIKEEGRAEGYNIQLKTTYLDHIVRVILSTIKKYLSENQETNKLLLLKNINGQKILDEYDFENIYPVKEMIDTTIHELVHVVQNLKQKHRSETEYRSYLTRDKEKFEEVIKDVKNHPEAYLYYASPQEIAAFAHDIASMIISKLDGKEVTSKMIQNEVNNFFDGIFKDVNHKKLDKVINRYYKLVYKEVTNYFSEKNENT